MGAYDDEDAAAHAYDFAALKYCGQIIPWNFPILMYAWKVGPALACRNSIVLKTVEHTPLFALYVSKRFHETGLPLSMLNIVSGSLASHIDVDKDPLKLVELCWD